MAVITLFFHFKTFQKYSFGIKPGEILKQFNSFSFFRNSGLFFFPQQNVLDNYYTEKKVWMKATCFRSIEVFCIHYSFNEMQLTTAIHFQAMTFL